MVTMERYVGNRHWSPRAQLLVGVAVTEVGPWTLYAKTTAHHGLLQSIVKHLCSQDSRASACSRPFSVRETYYDLQVRLAFPRLAGNTPSDICVTLPIAGSPLC